MVWFRHPHAAHEANQPPSYFNDLGDTSDFSKADPKLITKELIEGLLECLKRTAGKSTTLYSSFVGAEPYSIFKKMIEEKYPPQTDQQKKQDLIQKPAVQAVAPNGP